MTRMEPVEPDEPARSIGATLVRLFAASLPIALALIAATVAFIALVGWFLLQLVYLMADSIGGSS